MYEKLSPYLPIAPHWPVASSGPETYTSNPDVNHALIIVEGVSTTDSHLNTLHLLYSVNFLIS